MIKGDLKLFWGWFWVIWGDLKLSSVILVDKL